MDRLVTGLADYQGFTVTNDHHLLPVWQFLATRFVEIR
jgi:hypothetical protein